ncbi:NAD(P)/FAD-dependent oxidoreductase [Microlunatus elymi]|uniref:NAD(P)/FAD-dependent oxidoreductase n=1 Tax=Microlunatus elymi TaxID=2596828 RepID=UPI001AEFC6F6|nr:FAD-dependent oxidoreductase [Microlunatus elymi]
MINVAGSSTVIIGAGVIGVSTAVQLARRGADVTLVTAGDPADGASGRSLAWLNSAARSDGPYHRLRLSGLDRYRRYAADHPEAEVHFTGALNWAGPGDSYRARHDLETSAGYPSRWLSPDEVARAVPGVDPARSRTRARSSTRRTAGSTCPA